MEKDQKHINSVERQPQHPLDSCFKACYSWQLHSSAYVKILSRVHSIFSEMWHDNIAEGKGFGGEYPSVFTLQQLCRCLILWESAMIHKISSSKSAYQSRLWCPPRFHTSISVCLFLVIRERSLLTVWKVSHDHSPGLTCDFNSTDLDCGFYCPAWKLTEVPLQVSGRDSASMSQREVGQLTLSSLTLTLICFLLKFTVAKTLQISTLAKLSPRDQFVDNISMQGSSRL